MKTPYILKQIWFGGLLVLAGLTDGQAQTIWTNTAGGDWNTAANWNPNTVPAEGTTVTLTNLLATAYAITYTAPMSASSIGSLTINNPAANAGRQTLTV